jgi:oxygen-independent coproporphyrinogen-3 oxidase
MPGVYLSFPFCAQKCTYCNFASGVFPRSMAGDYLAKMRRELAATVWPWRPETVYLGGGTPSLIDPEAFEHLLAAVPGREWREATVEAAPGTFDRAKAAAWRRAGVNRVSLGVQSFVTAELRRTGRRHDAAQVAADVALLREHGLGEINIDLIAGLAGQTVASWRESLGWIERLAPPHVSVYMLEVDGDSNLGREILNHGSRYAAAAVPSDDAIAEMYETAVDELARLGIERYEISNFARPGSASRHNLKYWSREPYLGFGADAHSFDGRRRWQNVEAPAEYLARDNPAEEATDADPVAEKFFVGLRLERGVDPAPGERARYGERINRLVRAGVLEDDGATVRLTRRGVLVSNEVFAEFLE